MKLVPPTGRCCYDHLGGKLGKLMLDLYLREGWIAPEEGKTTVYRVTEKGRAQFEAMGLRPEELDGLVK